jgi:hypothetical protein
MVRNYLNGWLVRYEPNAPITGRWRAYRHGVRIGTTTYEGLTHMIRVRS